MPMFDPQTEQLRQNLAQQMTHTNTQQPGRYTVQSMWPEIEKAMWEMTPGVGDWIGWDRGANNFYQAGKQIAGGDLSGAKRLPDALMDMAGAIPGIGDIATGLKGIGAALPALATVWHGSPHRFDKFDISKIGTGEGAQAYGHGLYLADSRGVAESYRDQLSSGTVSGKDLGVWAQEIVDWAPGSTAEKGRELKHRLDMAPDDFFEANFPGGLSAKQELERMADGLIDGSLEYAAGGNLYRVDLPDSAIANMLDWDAPLSEQPEAVRKQLQALLDQEGRGMTLDRLSGDPTGAELYRMFGYGDYNTATQRLNQAGIPGIKYFDGGSRAAGEGTRNYVVFDDSLLNILERQ